jgi:hypothetical protein
MERPFVAYLIGDMDMPASVRKPRRMSIATAVDTKSWSMGKDRVDADGSTSQRDAWREALGLWLDWNSAYEKITERLYALGQDPNRMEEVMDHMDQIRHKAIGLSRQLVDGPGPLTNG